MTAAAGNSRSFHPVIREVDISEGVIRKKRSVAPAFLDDNKNGGCFETHPPKVG